MSDYITEKTLRYDDKCPVSEDATVSWCTIPKENEAEKFTIEK